MKKRIFSFLVLLISFAGIANALSMKEFLKYSSQLPGVQNVQQNNMGKIAKDLAMAVDKSNTMVVTNADEITLTGFKHQLKSINDSKYISVVKTEEGETLSQIFMENNKESNHKKLVIVVIESSNIIIVEVEGDIDPRYLDN